MVSTLKTMADLAGIVIAGILTAVVGSVAILLMLTPYMIGPLLILLVVLALVAAPFVRAAIWLGARRREHVAPTLVPVASGAAPMHSRTPVSSPVSVGATTPGATPALQRRIFTDVDIFRDLTVEEIGRVVSLGELVNIPVGRVLGLAGKPGNSLFIVTEGKAQLSSQSAIGDITVRVAGPGESFPLAALLGSGTLITSVKAMTDMEVLAIPRLRLRELCSADPRIGMRIYEAVADVLSMRYWRTLAHLTSTVEGALKAADMWARVPASGSTDQAKSSGLGST